jgi:hypothetical protein
MEPLQSTGQVYCCSWHEHNIPLLLIDRRNRLEGGLRRLEGLKRRAAELHRHVKRAAAEVDDLLDPRHALDGTLAGLGGDIAAGIG